MKMLKALWSGFLAFFRPKNLGALAALFLAAVLLAYAGATPDRVAAKIPQPSNLTGG